MSTHPWFNEGYDTNTDRISAEREREYEWRRDEATNTIIEIATGNGGIGWGEVLEIVTTCMRGEASLRANPIFQGPPR